MRQTNLLIPLLLMGSISATANMRGQSPDVDTRSLDEIYSAAQKESGPLIVAAGGDAQAQWDVVRTAFAKRFPKLKLNLTVDFSKYHDSRMDRALMTDGAHVADIFFIQDLHVFPRWRDQNNLLRYKPPTFNDIYNSHKDISGAYTGATLWSFGKFLYDKTKVKTEDLPQTYMDLLDPKWKGKLVLTYPNDDDAIGYLFSLIIGKYGWEWLYALQKQDVQWVRGTATPGYIIAECNDPAKAGGRPRPKEYKPDNDHRVLSFTTAGYPMQDDALAWSEPKSTEEYMSWTQTICIMKTTPVPETAKLFMAWVTSVEFQTMLSAGGTQPTMLKSINRKNNVTYLDDSDRTQLNGFRLYSSDRIHADWWRMQYESILGTAQGVSPMDVYNFDDVRAL